MWNDEVEDFNQLAAVWQSEAARAGEQRPTQAADIIARARMLDTEVRKRDRRETVVSLLMLPVFGVLAVVVPSMVSKIGAVLICLGCVITVVRLYWARQRKLDLARPLANGLRRELDWVHAQSRLLQTVVFWYLGPLGIGVILFVAGGKGGWIVALIVTLVVVALYSWLAVVNWRAAEQHLAPYRMELEAWLASLGKDQGER